GQYELVGEGEERHTIAGLDGTLKLLLYINRGRMGSYDAAVALADMPHDIPDTALVRKPADKAGAALNLEQQLAGDLGLFARLSLDDGSQEAYEFTEINRSFALGLSLKGAAWGRPDDVVGLAGVADAMSNAAQRYFAAGGMGI